MSDLGQPAEGIDPLDQRSRFFKGTFREAARQLYDALTAHKPPYRLQRIKTGEIVSEEETLEIFARGLFYVEQNWEED